MPRFFSLLLSCALFAASTLNSPAQWLRSDGHYGGTISGIAIAGDSIFAGTASGMYVYRLTAGSFVQARTLIMIQ